MGESVSTVLFDLDETLCYQPRSARDRLAAAFERAGVEPFFTAAEYHDLVDEIGGTESDITRRERCFVRLATERDVDEALGRRVADAYEALTDYTAVELVPGAETVLDRLGADYRLGLVTNGGPDTQSVKIDALGIRDRFETIVLAGYETPAKPDPTPIERALADMDVTSGAAVYVGNSPAADVAGARAAGVPAIWIPDAEGRTLDGVGEPAYTLDSIEGLLDEPWQ